MDGKFFADFLGSILPATGRRPRYFVILGIAAGIDEFSASPRINQYERGKHTPDFHTAERLARVLGCPTTYFYTREDDLAELILLWADLPERQRRRLLSQLRRQKGR